jgi:hypothetical protein
MINTKNITRELLPQFRLKFILKHLVPKVEKTINGDISVLWLAWSFIFEAHNE